MTPLTTAVCALFMTLQNVAAADTVPAAALPATDSSRTALPLLIAQDTVRKSRAKAVAFSDGYDFRLTWHRRLSWGMLPLFAASYFSGDQILKKNSAAPEWARRIHGPSATGSAVLFGANTITGSWNLWEGRSNPTGRTRRIVHSVLFTGASAGFVYAGTQLAEDAEQSQSRRSQHRNVALASMGVSTVSWLIMLLGN